MKDLLTLGSIEAGEVVDAVQGVRMALPKTGAAARKTLDIQRLGFAKLALTAVESAECMHLGVR